MTGHTLAKGRAATLIKLAFALDKRLKAIGKHTYLIYGNHLRQGLNSDLTFTDEDRTENIRRVGVVAKLFVDAGLIAIVVLISTFKIDRLTDLVKKGEFIEVYMSTPLEVCEQIGLLAMAPLISGIDKNRTIAQINSHGWRDPAKVASVKEQVLRRDSCSQSR